MVATTGKIFALLDRQQGRDTQLSAKLLLTLP
jgi:hypothetical protein